MMMDEERVQPQDTEHAKNWPMLYPLYLDKTFSREQGRRVKASLAVDMPDVDDYRQVFSFLGIPHVIELNKSHPRDFFSKGRVRYSIKKENGSLHNAEVKNKLDVLRKMGELIPKLKDRSKKHRSDLIDLKGIALPSMPSAPKKPKAIKVKKR